MRIIKRTTLIKFGGKHSRALQPLLSWYDEVKKTSWKKPQDVVRSFRTADIISGKRIVFNIKGNDYRLIADLEYRFGIVFIVWIGTHSEYDKIDVKTINYGS